MGSIHLGRGGVSRERPVLSAAEHEVAESILSDAWGKQVEVSGAEVVWKRRHVVRLGTRDGRSAILKRLRRRPSGEQAGRGAFGGPTPLPSTAPAGVR